MSRFSFLYLHRHMQKCSLMFINRPFFVCFITSINFPSHHTGVLYFKICAANANFSLVFVLLRMCFLYVMFSDCPVCPIRNNIKSVSITTTKSPEGRNRDNSQNVRCVERTSNSGKSGVSYITCVICQPLSSVFKESLFILLQILNSM
jgi:hypothetical protein